MAYAISVPPAQGRGWQRARRTVVVYTIGVSVVIVVAVFWRLMESQGFAFGGLSFRYSALRSCVAGGGYASQRNMKNNNK